jgi:DNA-binding CsgD family transcriptional regulator
MAHAADRDEVLRCTAAMLLDLVGADSVGWNAVDLHTGVAEVRPFPAEDWDAAELTAALAEAGPDHPLVRVQLDGRAPYDGGPLRLSDVATPAELRRNRAYVDFLRPWGIRYQLAVPVGPAAPGCARAWTLQRSGRDYTDRDVATARAVQPVLATLAGVIGPADPDRDGAAEQAHLTERESEVLRYVGAGLTADAVGRLLRISTRTVCKHLENAYRKLGCHDRLVAVQRAQALGLVPGPQR